MARAAVRGVKPFIRTMAGELASVRVGSILVITIFAFTLLAAFFPYDQAAGLIRAVGRAVGTESVARVSELGFQERFETLPFILLVCALGLSLCLSLFFRIRNEVRRWRAERAAQAQGAGERPRGGATSALVEAAEVELTRFGYRTRVLRAGAGWQVCGHKGGAGAVGSVLFHVCILLVLCAVFLSIAMSFRASVKLTEGQAFDARTGTYGVRNAGRWYTPSEQPLTFRLVRVDPKHELNGATTLASIVEPTLEGKTSRFLAQQAVYVSHGLEHAGVTIHQGRETGYAPYVVIEDAAGKRLIEGYTQLATAAGRERESYLDYVYVKDRDVSVELELLPDAVYRDGRYVSRSAALKKPVLRAVVRERGQVAFDQFVPITRDLAEGGYTVFFGDVRRWSQIDVVDAPGVPLLLAATLIGSLGLALRLLRVRRRVVVTLTGDGPAAKGFHLAGASEKFQRQFEGELAVLRAALAERLAAAGLD